MIVYYKLANILKERNMKWKDLCNAGISINTLTKFAQNRTINLDIIDKVCGYLQVQPLEIMEWIPEEEHKEKKEIENQVVEVKEKLNGLLSYEKNISHIDNGKIYTKQEYVYRKESCTQEFVLDVIRPEESLYNDVFGDGFNEFLGYEYELLKSNILSALDTLSDKEKKIISYRYGLNEEQEKIEVFCEENDLCSNRLNNLEQKALRKLRHPMRAKKFKSQYNEIEKKYIRTTDISLLKSIVFEDIKEYFWGEENKSSILHAFLEMEGLIICKNYIRELEESIDELGLSVRAYNALHYANINKVDKLLHRIDEVYNIKNIGEKTLTEIMLSIGKFNDGNGRTVVAEIEKVNGHRYVIEYGTEEEITNQIYKFMVDTEAALGNIFDYEISMGLIMFLLLKGYFHVDTLFLDWENVKTELHTCALYNLEKELEEFAKWIKLVLNKENELVQYFKVDERIAETIIKEKAKTYNQLIRCCNTENDEVNEIYKNIFLEFHNNNIKCSISNVLLQ